MSSPFQGGPCFEVFSPGGSKPLPFRMVNCKNIQREYDKSLKGYVVTVEGESTQSKIQLPRDEKASLQLTHPYLVVQLYATHGIPLYLEFVMTDIEGSGKWRVIFSSSVREASHTALHVKLPLNGIVWDKWLNLCFHMPQLMYDNFRQLMLKSTDAIILGPCKLRKIFTLRDAKTGIPSALDFPSGSNSMSLLFCTHPDKEAASIPTISNSVPSSRERSNDQVLPAAKSQALDALDQLLCVTPTKPRRLPVIPPENQMNDVLVKGHCSPCNNICVRELSREQKKVTFSASTKIEDGCLYGMIGIGEADCSELNDESEDDQIDEDSHHEILFIEQPYFDSYEDSLPVAAPFNFGTTIQRCHSSAAASTLSAAVSEAISISPKSADKLLCHSPPNNNNNILPLHSPSLSRNRSHPPPLHPTNFDMSTERKNSVNIHAHINSVIESGYIHDYSKDHTGMSNSSIHLENTKRSDSLLNSLHRSLCLPNAPSSIIPLDADVLPLSPCSSSLISRKNSSIGNSPSKIRLLPTSPSKTVLTALSNSPLPIIV